MTTSNLPPTAFSNENAQLLLPLVEAKAPTDQDRSGPRPRSSSRPVPTSCDSTNDSDGDRHSDLAGLTNKDLESQFQRAKDQSWNSPVRGTARRQLNDRITAIRAETAARKAKDGGA